MPQLSTFSNSVLDDHGQSHKLLPPVRRAQVIARRLLRDRTAGARFNRNLAALGTLAFGLTGAVLARAWVFYPSLSPVPGGICLFIALILAIATSSNRRRRASDLALLPTLPPACLACGYDLSGLEPEPDACTICPECGAAWRLPPPSAAPPAPQPA